MWKKQGVLVGRRSGKAKAGRRGRGAAETLRENSSDTVQVYKHKQPANPSLMMRAPTYTPLALRECLALVLSEYVRKHVLPFGF